MNEFITGAEKRRAEKAMNKSGYIGQGWIEKSEDLEQQLQTAKKENEILNNTLKCYQTPKEDILITFLGYAEANKILTQQNKQMREALEKIVDNKNLSKICINCNNYDDCHSCCNKDLRSYKYNDGTKTCLDFIYKRNLKDKAIAQQALNQAKGGE